MGQDRGINSREFRGHFAEIIAFNSKLPDATRQKVEGYLAHKWGLVGNLPSNHPYKTAHPLSSESPTFIVDTPFGDGKAIDLVDGHVEISTGGNEEVFDGNGSFSVSAWVKGWPNEALLPIISKGGSVPDPRKVPSMKLWLDAKDLSTMDQGTSAGAIGAPTNNSNVKYWADKSGNGHHATSTGSPKYNLNTINSSYPSVNTDVGDFTITNSQTAFDAWDSMTVILLFEWLDASNWEKFLYKGNSDCFVIQKMNTGANQGTGFRWGSGWGDRLNGNSKTDARSSRGSKILSFTYSGSARSAKIYANGTHAATSPTVDGSYKMAPSSLSSASSSPITFGKDQRYGELFIFRNSLSDADRQTVESYIAMKWGMTSTLPSSHLFHTSGGWSMGSDELTDSLSSNLYGVGGKELASHSTALSTDNQWHHIVSTYDGGNRKIFLDGTEVSSASASGSVASTTAALLLGAADLDSSTNTISAANHSGIKLDEVRFYSSGLTSTQVSALYNFGKGDVGNIGDFASLPSKISGTKGTALSTTVTAAFPNAYYEAVNLTPGLSINASTGEISGTPTVGGVGSITVIARNAAGKRAVTTIPYDSNPSGPAFSFPSPSPATDHAIILSEITHSGGEENTVDLVWSTNATLLDTQFPDLGTLNPDTNYYYQGMLPTGFPSLKIWLAADDNATLYSDTSLTTQATGTVAGWADKSGNDRHLLSQGDPTTGSRTHNGKNVIDFDGNDYFETSASYDSGDDFSFLMVAGIDSINNLNDSILAIRQTVNHPSFQIDAESNSAFKVRLYHNDLGTQKTFASSAQHGPSIYEFIFNGTTNLLEVFLDGTSLGTTAYTTAPLSGNKLNIFSNRGQNQMPDGFVAEVIGFSTALSNDERQDAESYLAHKWGITLPNSHPHKTNPALGWSSTFQASLPVYASAINTGSGKEGFYGTTINGLTAGETYHYRTRSTGKQNPKSISSNDLKLWLDASDTASIEMDSSNKVYKWHDKSGNGYDAFGSVNNQLPLYSSTGINSKPALSFDGSNDFLEANTRLGLPANPAITVLMVARVNQHAQADERFFEIGGGSHHLAVSTGSEGWSWRHNGGQGALR